MEIKFCTRCGSLLDEKTKLCPNCDAAAIQALDAKAKKKKKGAIIGGSVGGGVLLIAIIVVVIILVVSKSGGKGSDDKQDTAAVNLRGAYSAYLHEKFIPEHGEFDINNPKYNNTGLDSALTIDMDGDKEDEMIVLYADSDGKNLTYKLDCYDVEDTKGLSEVGSENIDKVQNIGSYEVAEQEDYLQQDDIWQMPIDMVVYAFEKDGVQYVTVQQLWYYEGATYECHIFRVKDGKFVEDSNIYVPAIGNNGDCIVESTLLPSDMKIDNSDLPSKYKDFRTTDGYVLYLATGDDSEYVYDVYYSDIDSAVSAYFNCYGLTVKEYDRGYSDGYEDYRSAIQRPKEDVTYIFSYAYYVVYTYDDIGGAYDINDYTDRLADKTTLEATDEDMDNFLGMIKDTSAVWQFYAEDLDDYADIERYYNLIISNNERSGLYTYYFGESGMEGSSTDPRHQFGSNGCTRLDAEKVDWIMENVFSRKPYHDFVSYDKYYDGDSFYRTYYGATNSPYSFDYNLTEKKKLDDGRYSIVVTATITEKNEYGKTHTYDSEYCFIARLAEDQTIGKYWKIDSFTTNYAFHAAEWDNALTDKDVTIEQLEQQYRYCHDYYAACFSGSTTGQDYEHTIEGGNYSRTNYGSIDTYDEFLAQTKVYFADSLADEFVRGTGAKDYNGVLYTEAHGGIGGAPVYESFEITKVDDEKYKIVSTYELYDSSETYTESRYFVYENGRWVIDNDNIGCTILLKK